jgi:prepilin-type N-terminal cleavage/methylation domain-containing protein
MKNVPPPKASQAFTLIELLVVIAIIGILAALLLPVLSRAKNHASKVTDLNNLKQVMVATHLYAADNEDHMPLPNWDNGNPIGDGKFHAGWLYLGDPAGTPNSPERYDVKKGLLWQTLHDLKVYLCPMDKPEATTFGQRPQQISSYAMNGAVTGYMRGWTHPEEPSIKLSAFLPGDCAYWETDETHPDYFNDGANYPSEGVSARHSQGGIQAAFDSSVSYVRLDTWYAEESQTNKNRLWCYPNSADGGDPDEPGHPQHP